MRERFAGNFVFTFLQQTCYRFAAAAVNLGTFEWYIQSVRGNFPGQIQANSPTQLQFISNNIL